MDDQQAIAARAELDAELAADRARYQVALAYALAHPRLGLVLRRRDPQAWTVTYRGSVLGEVTNDRADAVLGGWLARPAAGGQPAGPYRTARAAAASMIDRADVSE